MVLRRAGRFVNHGASSLRSRPVEDRVEPAVVAGGDAEADPVDVCLEEVAAVAGAALPGVDHARDGGVGARHEEVLVEGAPAVDRHDPVHVVAGAVVDLALGGELPRPFQADGVEAVVEADRLAALLRPEGVDLLEGAGAELVDTGNPRPCHPRRGEKEKEEGQQRDGHFHIVKVGAALQNYNPTMPPRIQLLPENVANQIAAGEVIERPASVLKELLENSLDAGAKQVDVRTRDGGRSLIEVGDDGSGMNRDDALLCLERHATSKLRKTEDLHHLVSYGFRGEALPSIASVSKFVLRTRENDPAALSGTEVTVNGGKLLSVREAGLAHGTQIEVRSLFYNLPARRKFLRAERTELAHLRHTLLLAGLSRPDVGFQSIDDDEPPVRWPAGQNLERRIAAIFGEAWLRDLVPVSGQDGDLRLSGFLGKPGVSRATRQEQFLFVNNRAVESRTLHFALQEGYHNSLMRGRYPVTVLFLALDPEGVDVNIHPAKREVRFHDDARVRFFLKQSIQRALEGFAEAPISVPVGRVREAAPAYAVQLETAFLPPEIPRTPEAPPVRETVPVSSASAPLAPAPEPDRTVLRGAAPLVALQARTESNGNRLGLRLLGIVANLYIVAESPEGLVLIDQHAAHERVMFEKVLDRMRRREVESQRLLLPATVELPPREADFLEAQLDSLQAIGVGISLFGARTFLVDALPPMVAHLNVPELVRNLVSELQEEGGETRKERRLSEEAVAKKACRLAVKANDRLSPAEGERLLADLLDCALPYTCPHGRPTMIQITRGELEKKFGRTG